MTAAKERYSNIEFLRILSMFLIVVHHFAFHGFDKAAVATSEAGWQVNSLLFGGGVGVAVFVLISGYFMVCSKITGKKLLRLWVEIFTISMSLYLLFRFVPQEGIRPHEGFCALFAHFFPLLTNEYWFMSVFVLLMLLSPFLNRILHHMTKMEMRWLILVQVAFCSACSAFPYGTAAIGDIGFFVMLYTIAAYIRLHAKTPAGRSGIWLFIALFTLAAVELVVFYINEPASVVAAWIRKAVMAKYGLPNLLMAVALFMAALSWRMKSRKWLNSMASCTLGVYLIHDNTFVRPFLWKNIFHNQDMLVQGSGFWLHFITTVLTVYLGCTLVIFVWKNTIERAYICWIEPRLLPILRHAGGFAAKMLEGFCARYIDLR